MPQIHRILVPVDFSEPSRLALAQAENLAAALGATVDALAVWEPPNPVSPDVMITVPGWSAASIEMQGVEGTRKQLAEFVNQVRESPATVNQRIDKGNPAATILRVADEGYDLIVMGTVGRGSFSRAMLGSVSAKVAAHASCPVLVVNEPPSEVEAAQAQT